MSTQGLPTNPWLPYTSFPAYDTTMTAGAAPPGVRRLPLSRQASMPSMIASRPRPQCRLYWTLPARSVRSDGPASFKYSPTLRLTRVVLPSESTVSSTSAIDESPAKMKSTTGPPGQGSCVIKRAGLHSKNSRCALSMRPSDLAQASKGSAPQVASK